MNGVMNGAIVGEMFSMVFYKGDVVKQPGVVFGTMFSTSIRSRGEVPPLSVFVLVFVASDFGN